jgi:hypothetical protein
MPVAKGTGTNMQRELKMLNLVGHRSNGFSDTASSDAGKGKQSMKIILKLRGADRYWVKGSDWTNLLPEATDFKTFLAILDHCQENKVGSVEALFCFEERKYDFTVRVR